MQKNCNTSVEAQRKEKGTDPFCRNGPQGAAHKRGLSPFPPGSSIRPTGIQPSGLSVLSIGASTRFPVLDILSRFACAVSRLTVSLTLCCTTTSRHATGPTSPRPVLGERVRVRGLRNDHFSLTRILLSRSPHPDPLPTRQEEFTAGVWGEGTTVVALQVPW